MADKRSNGMEEARRQVAETAWLHYFNRVLYEQNLITQRQHTQIAGKIAARKP